MPLTMENVKLRQSLSHLAFNETRKFLILKFRSDRVFTPPGTLSYYHLIAVIQIADPICIFIQNAAVSN
jgi:hypothetical protein